METKQFEKTVIKELNKEKKILRNRIIYRLIGLLLFTGGFAVLWYEFGWKMFVAIFLMVWGNNVLKRLEK